MKRYSRAVHQIRDIHKMNGVTRLNRSHGADKGRNRLIEQRTSTTAKTFPRTLRPKLEWNRQLQDDHLSDVDHDPISSATAEEKPLRFP